MPISYRSGAPVEHRYEGRYWKQTIQCDSPMNRDTLSRGVDDGRVDRDRDQPDTRSEPRRQCPIPRESQEALLLEAPLHRGTETGPNISCGSSTSNPLARSIKRMASWISDKRARRGGRCGALLSGVTWWTWRPTRLSVSRNCCVNLNRRGRVHYRLRELPELLGVTNEMTAVEFLARACRVYAASAPQPHS